MICKECIHFDDCGLYKVTAELTSNSDVCCFFLDKSRYIKLPCKVGDIVYEIQNNTDACHDCPYYSEFYGMDEMCDKTGDYLICPTVSDEPLCEKQFYEIVSYTPNLDLIISKRNMFGKTIFLNQKEAEDELKRRLGNEHKGRLNNEM